MSTWNRTFGSVQASVERRLNLVARKVALDAFSRVIRRTPVDTGRARGSWGASLNATQPGPSDRTDTTGAAATSEAASEAGKLTLSDSIYLTSNLVYMPVLENGSSQQAPSGMVKVTANEMQPVVDRVVRAVRAG